MENRNTILIDFRVEPADGYAERRAALTMLDENLPGSRRITVAGDRGYDTQDFIASCRTLRVTPHVARNLGRPGGSALDARTVRHPGYAVSQWIRKQVEETFGWMKTVGGLRRTRYRGRARADACLPGSRRLQSRAHRQPQPCSRMNTTSANLNSGCKAAQPGAPRR
jgi:hypothetical protein